MRVYNYGSTEAPSIKSQIEFVAMPPQSAQEYSSAIELDADDNATNSWVEALLDESSAETIGFGGVSLEIPRRMVTCQGRHARFSQLDFALLLVLARHRNKMLSYSRIYRRLWGPTCKVSVPRLRVHVFRLRRRLDEAGMVGIRIVNRGGLGYMMEIDGHALRRASRRQELQSGPNSEVITTASRSFAPKFDSRRVSTAAE